MKIEICEQMMQSWLLNCKLCEVVQTNWKLSPLYIKTISPKEIAYVQAVMDDIKASEPDLASIFGRNSAEQFVRQCEIDIVGVKFGKEGSNSIYLVDTAFHKDGLGYSNPRDKVTMKIIRAAVISRIVFGMSASIKVIFASPFCHATPKHRIISAVNAILPIVKKHYPNVAVEIYFNEDFSLNVYKPLVQNMADLFDDNDLFMRSLHLAKIAEDKMPKSSKNTTAAVAKSASSGTATASARTGVPTIVLDPADPKTFKDELLIKKRAEITWIYSDGTQEDKVWNASKFSASSDAIKNLQGRPEWRNKDKNGLIEVRVKVI